jgi:phosphoribosylamine--glycine ligase
MARINALVLGGGGREHALAHALSKSDEIAELHCAPGNPGIASLARVHGIDACDADAVVAFCRSNGIGLVVIGPEAPLVCGVSDALRENGVGVFGPGASGARLEGSKAFSKEFMRRHGIPTAAFDVCLDAGECARALDKRRPPYVIKADGLAAGKGVLLTGDRAEAEAICSRLLSGETVGDAGKKLIIEDHLPGKELTMFAMTDGKSFKLLPPSRDHKRIFDGDKGPNTGGMGAYSPVTLPDGIIGRVTDEVLRPTLEGLRADGIDYRGVVYMGLMLNETPGGVKISVVEYNARFGDPETQAVLPLIKSDLGKILRACAEGWLGECPDPVAEGAALCVTLASEGYPGTYAKGFPISGLGDFERGDGTYVYHAGTKTNERGETVTAGGRVLSVVGTGAAFAIARERAYARVNEISFEGKRFRRDIGRSEE